jgi:hypothetical protein
MLGAYVNETKINLIRTVAEMLIGAEKVLVDSIGGDDDKATPWVLLSFEKKAHREIVVRQQFVMSRQAKQVSRTKDYKRP